MHGKLVIDMPVTGSGPTPKYVKTAVFVDGGFLETLVRERFRGKQLCIRPFLSRVLEPINRNRSIEFLRSVRTYYYDAIPEDLSRINENLRERFQKKIEFLNYLEEFCERVDVRRGFLRFSGDPNKRPEQKGVDVSMGSDIALISWMGKIDEIVIVAADGDLVPAVEVAKRAMVVVHLISDAKKVNPNLKKTADTYFLNLEEFIKEADTLILAGGLSDPAGLPVELSKLSES